MIKMSVNTQEFSNLSKLVKSELDIVVTEAYKFFKQNTPIRSGNARSRTRLNKNNIEANYPYAERLNTGWSKQAPRGMTEPTTEYIEKKLIPAAIGRINRG